METIEEIVASIEKDTRHGATYLAERGLEALNALAFVLESDAEDPCYFASAIEELVLKIAAARPAMGAIGTQALLAYEQMKWLVAKGIPTPSALKKAVAKEKKNLKTADSIIAKALLDDIGPGGKIATCSSSQTVKTVMPEIKPSLIYVAEGQGLGDGAEAARWFSQNGFNVELVLDNALATIVKDIRAAIIGADQVLADGSVVNRCGSLSLALAAEYFRVPFFVACQGIKLTGLETVSIEEHCSFEASTNKIPIWAPIFDITPPKLIKKIFTESKVMSPLEAGRIGKERRTKMDAIMVNYCD